MTEQEISNPTTYDEVPYPAHPYSQSHPDRLAALAYLFGMTPTPVSKCRVLELGCANGANLIPMACGLPQSQFVGIDLSAHEVAEAETIIKELKLKNIEIKKANILEVNQDYGKFDYIIVHGIISWVPAEVRTKILQICQEQLAPNGVAYVSYNTYPGWHMRGMLRDMMRYHIRNFKDIHVAIRQARALINFLGESVPTEKNPYGMLLKNELETMKRWQDNYFRHDSLEEINEPLYFYQFAEQAAEQGLQYLGEADFHTMLAGNFSTKVQETLQNVAKNIVSMEQYMDFLRNRMFRQTLLCHKEVTLNRQIKAEVLQSLYVCAPVQPVSQTPDIASDKPEEFRTTLGRTLTVNNPLSKALWIYLTSTWPKPVSIDEAVSGVGKILEKDQVVIAQATDIERQKNLLCDLLFLSYAKGVVQLYTRPLVMTTEVSAKPMVSELVRYQAEHQQAWVTNQRHEVISVDAFTRYVLRYLDGGHDLTKLLKVLAEQAAKGEFTVQKGGVAVTEPDKLKDVIQQQLQTLLTKLAKSGLLVG